MADVLQMTLPKNLASLSRFKECVMSYTKGPWSYGAKLSGSENHRGFRVGTEKSWLIAEVMPICVFHAMADTIPR